MFIVLTTHFGQQRLQLEIEPAEPERRNVRSTVASGPVANQLQRAVVKAFCCLTAPFGTSEQAQQDAKESHVKGLEILDAIDELERYFDLLETVCATHSTSCCKYARPKVLYSLLSFCNRSA